MIDVLKLNPMSFKEYIELVTDEEINDEIWIDLCPDYYERFSQYYLKDMQRICYEPEKGDY